MKSKAILFGLNYINTPSARLYGCINDVKNMAKFLKEEAKYDVVKEYTDEHSMSKVTGNYIINSIYKLAIDSHRYNLDRVWIHYSGHGCAINDRDGDEKDGKDECIVPADYHNGVITDDLIKRVLRYFNKKTKVIISIFAGRAGDVGKDPVPEFKKSITMAKKFKNVEILWASVREPYNYLQAKQLGCHIITIPPSIIEKIENFGKTFEKLTEETVKTFLLDSRKAKFKI